MAFKKGQSGNPGGRPKGEGRLRDLARPYTEEALQAMINVMRNSEDEKARVIAADKILDRGWGKAAQPVEHSGEIGNRDITDQPLTEQQWTEQYERPTH